MTVQFILIAIALMVVGAAIVLLACLPLLKRSRKTEAELRSDLAAKAEQHLQAATECTALEERLKAQQEKLEFQQKEMAEMQARQRIDFKNLAAEILEEKSVQFKQTNKESLDALLKPFKDNISQFRERVEKIYSEENHQRGALQNEIKNLQKLNMRMSEEANNLTAALKGNSKTQGDWGEMLLETILDGSNLVKGIHYQTQENLKDEGGGNLRPDVILNLPEGKQIIIDSKVSLTAYVNFTEAETPEATDRAVKAHLKSVRSHVEELGRKSYQAQVDSPDFVIMFIPNEPAFLLALQREPKLWNDAYNKKVIISSPTNLFALLKIVYDLWKRADQNKNAIKIAEEGANLYDKFMGFAETLLDLGRSISTSSDKYDKAMNQLKTGTGNLIRRTEKLRQLGVRATKNLPAQLEDYDEEE